MIDIESLLDEHFYDKKENVVFLDGSMYNQEKYVSIIEQSSSTFGKWTKNVIKKKDYNIAIMDKFRKYYGLINPPYDGKSSLHLKTIDRFKDICEEAVVISPDQWLKKSNVTRPFGQYREILNGYVDSVEHLDHRSSNELFGSSNGIESLSIYVIKNNGKIDLENYGFDTDIEKSLYHKIDISKDTEGLLTFNSCKYNDEFGYLKYKNHPMERTQYDVPVYAWHSGNDCYDAVIMSEDRQKKGVSFTLRFKSADECKNFKDSLNTVFMKWYYHNFIVPGDYKLMNYMFRMKDYSSPWTSERFYEFFNLTADEIKIIEDFVANE